MTSILAYPGLDLVEAIFSQRVQAFLPVAAGLHDSGFGQNAQMSRNSGLANVHPFDDLPHGAFARPHDFNNAKPRRIGKSLEYRNIQIHIYTYTWIFRISQAAMPP